MDKILAKLSSKAGPVAVLMAGLLVLAGLHQTNRWLARGTARAQADFDGLTAADDNLSQTVAELAALRNLKTKDLNAFKERLSGITRSRREVYESGLSLQEEKRLLEKQLEMMSVYLRVDERASKISLMKGDQALKDFAVLFSTPRAFGGETKKAPDVVQIVSKERFAHPERGKMEESDGTLTWNPPQVGTSVRSNALGEFVIFTDGPLIIHGPPKKAKEHDLFPHLCLGVSLPSAQKLYRSTFIGTRIVLKTSK